MAGKNIKVNREKIFRNHAERKENLRKKKWKYNPKERSYTKKYKGEYITIMRGRYGFWGISLLDQRIWVHDEKRIYSFEDAQRIAFEIIDEFDN